MKLMINKSKIPVGLFCYTILGKRDNNLVVEHCPYRLSICNKTYCNRLIIQNYSNGKLIELEDDCKNCKINLGVDDDWFNFSRKDDWKSTIYFR